MFKKGFNELKSILGYIIHSSQWAEEEKKDSCLFGYNFDQE